MGNADGDEDVFLESFVDVLSCGLGAALVLFLVFAVMPQSGRPLTMDPRVAAGAMITPDEATEQGKTEQLVIIVTAPEQHGVAFTMRPSSPWQGNEPWARLNHLVGQRGEIGWALLVDDRQQSGLPADLSVEVLASSEGATDSELTLTLIRSGVAEVRRVPVNLSGDQKKVATLRVAGDDWLEVGP